MSARRSARTAAGIRRGTDLSREPEEPVAESEEARALAEGVSLFNACRYHDAHESFERLWLATTGRDSDFYKGLIQASIAMHHTQEGNLDGARKLYSGHRRLLAAYVPEHRGLDVAGLLSEMQRSLRPLLRSEALDLAAPPPRMSLSTPA
jgi:predicted metal-dependent hydrolase